MNNNLDKKVAAVLVTIVTFLFIAAALIPYLKSPANSGNVGSSGSSTISKTEKVDFKASERIIYDNYGISVELLSVDGDANGFTFQIVNNSGEDIHYAIRNYSVNGWLMERSLMQKIYNGMKDTVHVYLEDNEINFYEMHGVEYADFKIYLKLDGSSNYLDIPTFHVETSLAGNNNYYKAEIFTLMMQNEGISVYGAYGNNIGIPYYLMIVNETDADANFTYSNVAFDGEMAYSMAMGPYVNGKSKIIIPGLYTTSRINLYLSDDTNIPELASNVKYDLVATFIRNPNSISTQDVYTIGTIDLDFDVK